MRVETISICSWKHRHVWKLTSELLPSLLPAEKHTVYVPAAEQARFQKMTPATFTIATQEELGANFSQLLMKSTKQAGNHSRYGWYLQQLLKIEALTRCNLDVAVIWDSDCVPVSPIKIVDATGRLQYMRAKELHAPYFESIERLLGLSRVQDQSFVIPGFPIRQSWIRELIGAIEKRHGGHAWYQAIIECTDLRLKSGFSETETLGTWIANSYPEAWSSCDYAWERLGQSRFGYAHDFAPADLRELAKQEGLDIISFENWDYRGVRRLLEQIRGMLRGTR